MKERRLAVYCLNCQMWFDTKKGWQAKTSGNGITPLCPCCKCVLMQIDYKIFIDQNKKEGRLDEVMTWEYPDGSFWHKEKL